MFDQEASQAIAIPENYSARFLGLIELLLATGQASLAADLIVGVGDRLDTWVCDNVRTMLDMVEAVGERKLASFWRDECARRMPDVII